MGEIVVTYLEIGDPGAIRPARPPRVACEVVRVDPPDGAVNRSCYEAVGAPWRWTEHLGRDAAWWDAHAAAVDTWLLEVGGERAGYYELHPVGDDVELAYFGLLERFHGAGLGGHLLEHALRRGFALGSRVWVHTCTDDGPHALANYEARGLVRYRTER